jgi:site-specific DNA recombinase
MASPASRQERLIGQLQVSENGKSRAQRVQASLTNATFEQKRRLVELLIDRVIVTNAEVEIRYVIPTHPRSEHVRFCQLRQDYFQVVIQVAVGMMEHPVPEHSSVLVQLLL